MNQTTTATSIHKPKLETIKRFFQTLTSPSPLGWIIVAGLSFTSATLLTGHLIAVALLLPAIYVGLFGLERAVKELKRTVIDGRPSSEYRFWTRSTKRLIRSSTHYLVLILIATIGQLAMAIPMLLDAIWNISTPPWLAIGCGLSLVTALGAYAVALWYNPMI